jgi:hypothetical protein
MDQKPDSTLQFTVAADKLHGVYPQKQNELYLQRINTGRKNKLAAMAGYCADSEIFLARYSCTSDYPPGY